MQDDLDGLLICFSSISESCCCGNAAWLKGHKSCVGCRHHTGELGYWGLEPNAIGRSLARLQGTRFRKPVDTYALTGQWHNHLLELDSTRVECSVPVRHCRYTGRTLRCPTEEYSDPQICSYLLHTGAEYGSQEQCMQIGWNVNAMMAICSHAQQSVS